MPRQAHSAAASSPAAARSKPRKVGPVPKGYHSVIPYLAVRDGAAALDFYQQVFGADKLMEYHEDGGRLAHAELKVGDAHLMLAEENPALGFHAPTPGSASVMVYLDGVDAVVERAERAGARVVSPVQDQVYGDRSGIIVDPFGHRWMVSTHVEDVTPREAERRMQAQHQG
jgi:PhnB protein